MRVPLWQAVLHDWSKFLPDEWFPYVEWFYTDKKSREWFELTAKYGMAELAPYGACSEDRFNYAWNAHQKRHKHHWQYWLLTMDTGATSVLPMPEVHVREMLADWIGAGMAIAGRSDPRPWYAENKRTMKLNPVTRELVEKLLQTLV